MSRGKKNTVHTMTNLQLTNKISSFVLTEKRFSCNVILPKLITFPTSQHLHYNFPTTKNTLFKSKKDRPLRGT